MALQQKTRNRSFIGWLFAAGGALQLLALLISLTHSGDTSAVYFLSNVAIGGGFVLLMLSTARTTVSRVAYAIAAAGWLLLALTSILNLGPVFQLALLVAIVGSVFAAAIVFVSHVFSVRAATTFLIAMALGALNLLFVLIGGVNAWLVNPVIVLFGAGLIVAGLWIAQRR
jgi:hypothetical protein